jgi:hypothetical protein
MSRARRWVQLALALGMIASIAIGSGVSAQQKDQLQGAWDLIPNQKSYTATDDLWTWRTNRNGSTSVQSGRVSSRLSFLETLEDIGDTFWQPGDTGWLSHQMQVDLRYVPDMDSDSSGMISRTRNVEVSGQASGRLGLPFRPEIGDEVIVGALTWNAKISGVGVCAGDDCEILYEISGKLSDRDGRRNCGDMSVTARSSVHTGNQTFGFNSVSGMDSETEVIEFAPTTTSLRVSQGGVTCISGITGDSKTLTSDVRFYYGEEVADIDDARPYDLGAPLRIMPGDNVTINDPANVMPGDSIRLFYADIPVKLLESLDSIGDTLWDPNAGHMSMRQDMAVDLRFDPEQPRNVELGGDVRVAFSSGVHGEGRISGSGTCEGENCTVQMIREILLFDARRSHPCGTMELAVTASIAYDNGINWTFQPDGSGSIILRDHPSCLLETLEDVGDT